METRGVGSMKFSKTGAELRVRDRYYDYHDWNIMQVAQKILRNAVEACIVCGSPAIRRRKQGGCKDGDGADGGRRGGPRAISRLIAQVLQVHPISHSRNTMEMVQEQKSVPILSLFVPVSFRRHEGPMQGKCMGVKEREKKEERKEGRKMNRRNCEKSIIEAASQSYLYCRETVLSGHDLTGHNTASRLLKRAKNLISILASSEVISLRRNENRYFIR